VDRSFGVDSTAWPLVVMRIPSVFDAPTVDRFAQQYDAVLDRKEKFALLSDTTALTKLPSAIERQHIAQLWKARTFVEATYCLGCAVVIASTPARTVFTAILWLRPPAVEQHLVGKFEDAFEWCCGRLVRAGIPLTPKIEGMRQQKAIGSAAAARR
jgi:hypothetical protein